MRARFCRAGIWLLLAAILAVPCFAESMHREIDNPQIQVEATVGYDGLMTYGRVMPIRVRIENSGTDLEAVVAVNVYNSRYTYNRYEMELELAQGAAKELMIPVTANSKQENFTIEVLQGDQVICAVNAAPEQVINPSAMLIGALSTDPKSLSYMTVTAETDDLLYSEYMQVVPLTEKTFPSDMALMESFGALVVEGCDVGALSAEQWDVLTRWLSEGHILIVGGGAQSGVTYPGFSDLTGILPGRVFQSEDVTPGLLDELEVSAEPLGQEIALNEAEGGETALEYQGMPLIRRSAVGEGVVYTAAFELGAKPLSSWPFMHTFWQRLWRKDCYRLYQQGFARAGNEYSSVPYLVTRIPIQNDSRMAVVAVGAAAFLLLGGIVACAVLKRADRRQYLWGVIPALSLACAGLIAAAAAGSAFNQPAQLSIGMLAQEADGSQNYESYAGVALSGLGEHRVTSREWTIIPYNEEPYYDDDVSVQEPTKMEYRYMMGADSGIGTDFGSPWNPQVFKVTGIPTPEGGLETVLWREDDGIHGYIVNNTGMNLTEGAVVCRYGYCSVPALKPGDRFDVALKSATFADPANPVYEDGCMYESLAEGYASCYAIIDEYFYKTSQRRNRGESAVKSESNDTALKSGLMQAASEQYYRQDSAYYSSIFTYIAFCDELPEPVLTLDGAAIGRRFSQGVVSAEMQFKSVGETGVIYHMPGMDVPLRCKVDDSGAPIDGSASATGVGSYHVLRDKPAFVFELGDVRDAQIDRLVFYCDVYANSVRLYLYDGEDWVEQPLAKPVDDPERYIGEDGRLYIQFRADASADEYNMEITTPLLLLEGRVR